MSCYIWEEKNPE